jgi:hypothetical protein
VRRVSEHVAGVHDFETRIGAEETLPRCVVFLEQARFPLENAQICFLWVGCRRRGRREGGAEGT